MNTIIVYFFQLDSQAFLGSFCYNKFIRIKGGLIEPMTLHLIKALKYGVATFFAIFLAQWLHLDYAVSAGIIAILTLADTNQQTVHYIGNISLAMVLSLTVARLLFYYLGFTVWVFALYLLITYPLAAWMKSGNAIAPCAVSVSHLLLDQTIAFPDLMNEFLLLIIGTGIALLVNFLQPSHQKEMAQLKEAIEDRMRTVLCSYADQLDQGTFFEQDHFVLVLHELSQLIQDGQGLAARENANRMNQDTLYYKQYFAMRQAQSNVLYQIAESLQRLDQKTSQHQDLAQFLIHVSEQLNERNPALGLSAELDQLIKTYRESDLPQTRKEFELRATLFAILTDCKKFLKLKKNFYYESNFIYSH